MKTYVQYLKTIKYIEIIIVPVYFPFYPIVRKNQGKGGRVSKATH